MPPYQKPTSGEPLTVKGKIIPFTFWPENYLKYGRFLASDCWQCLKSNVISSGFNQTLKSRIQAYITQSSDFYEASRNASVDTKPLMLYYCYLNLVKAFLLFRQKRIPTHPDGHGISASKPAQRYHNLKSIKFRIWGSKDNRRMRHIFNSLVKECGFPTLAGKTFSLADMMHQVCGLHDAFNAMTREKKVIFPVSLKFVKDATKKTVWIKGVMDTSSFTDTQKYDIKRYLRNSEFTIVSTAEDRSAELTFETSEKIAYGKSPITILKRKLVNPIRHRLWSEQTCQGYKYYILCANKGFTAQVASNFSIMFALGSIVRYRPELFNKINREWIIHEYLNTQPLQFAYLLGSGMVSNEIIPSALPI